MKTIILFSSLAVLVAIAVAQYDDCDPSQSEDCGDGDMYDDREDTECKDTISKERCEAKKAKGRCETEKGKKKCPLTCGVCTANTN